MGHTTAERLICCIRCMHGVCERQAVCSGVAIAGDHRFSFVFAKAASRRASTSAHVGLPSYTPVRTNEGHAVGWAQFETSEPVADYVALSEAGWVHTNSNCNAGVVGGGWGMVQIRWAQMDSGTRDRKDVEQPVEVMMWLCAGYRWLCAV